MIDDVWGTGVNDVMGVQKHQAGHPSLGRCETQQNILKILMLKGLLSADTCGFIWGVSKT